MDIDQEPYRPFSKKELLSLARNKELPLILSTILTSFQTKTSRRPDNHSVQIYLLTCRILKIVAHSIQLCFQKGEIYEAVSQQYHKFGVSIIVIRNLEELLSDQ